MKNLLMLIVTLLYLAFYFMLILSAVLFAIPLATFPDVTIFLIDNPESTVRMFFIAVAIMGFMLGVLGLKNLITIFDNKSLKKINNWIFNLSLPKIKKRSQPNNYVVVHQPDRSQIVFNTETLREV